jgi:transposase
LRSAICSARQGRAADWQICLAHQLCCSQFAIEAGGAIFATRIMALLLRVFALARRRTDWP